MKKHSIIAALLTLMLLLGACGENAQSEQEAPADGDAATVWRLSIVQMPDRIVYEEGEQFDATGIIIDATMKDGSVVNDVPWEMAVDAPLTRTSLGAEFAYGGKKTTQMISVTIKGNREEYSVAQTPQISDSPLSGKTIYWLGSSVTAGASSGKESMADFIAKKHGAVCIKEAVSGTTLAEVKNGSYVERFNAYLASDDRAQQIDAFVCQLSTNDKGSPETFGTVTAPDVRDLAAFDRGTTFGAIEYIAAMVKETWNCPVYFYTNPPMGDENYEKMVEALEEISAKWDLKIIDLYWDEVFNDLTAEERALYLYDSIHPSKAGYREWWLPKFEEALSGS